MRISVVKRDVCRVTRNAGSGRPSHPTISSNEDPYPVDTGPVLAHFLRQYKGTREPIAVSFRELVNWLKVGERLTHYLHPYPAKLLPQIAHFFLASKLLVDHHDVVLDPFAGTGTVALETILSGRPALYADANPLARLISLTKTRDIEDGVIECAAEHVRRKFLTSRARTAPDVVNLGKWFDSDVVCKLLRLRAAFNSLDDPAVRDLMRVTFSAVIRKASKADPRFSVPVRRRNTDPSVVQDVWRLFEVQLEANRGRLRALHACSDLGEASPAGRDARRLRTADGSAPLPDSSVGMVLTSPPYAGAQKYVRATSLSLGWLGLASSNSLRHLEDLTIGREHYPKAAVGKWKESGVPEADELIELICRTNPTRATIAATYLSEMRSACVEAVRVLQPGGHFVLVIGDNTVCGHRFTSSEYLRQMLEQMGLVTILWLIDPIRARGLITRRAATAGVIVHESVIILRKPTCDA
jgi:hypothetical protein